jgi:hypothetical protein
MSRKATACGSGKLLEAEGKGSDRDIRRSPARFQDHRRRGSSGRTFQLHALIHHEGTRFHNSAALVTLQVRQRIHSPAFVNQLLGGILRKSFISIAGQGSHRQPKFQPGGAPRREAKRGGYTIAAHRLIDRKYHVRRRRIERKVGRDTPSQCADQTQQAKSGETVYPSFFHCTVIRCKV